MKKVLNIILSLSLLIAEIISYFLFNPRNIENFIFRWLIISIVILIYSIVEGPQTGIHVFTSSLGNQNDSMRYLNLSTETQKILSEEKRKNITFSIQRNLFTLMNVLMIVANLIIYSILIKKLY